MVFRKIIRGLNILGIVPKKIELISVYHLIKKIFKVILSIFMVFGMIIGFIIAMLLDKKERKKEYRVFPDYFYDKYGDIIE